MNFVIEKDFPVPTNRTKYPFGSMEVGDSFVFPESARSKISSSAAAAAHRHGRRFSIAKIGDGNCRLWRVE